jgi:septum formation protein
VVAVASLGVGDVAGAAAMVRRPRLVLASASPARRALLAAAGIDCETVVSGVDEAAVSASGAEALCLVLARMKAQAVAERLRQAGGHRQASAARGPRTVPQDSSTSDEQAAAPQDSRAAQEVAEPAAQEPDDVLVIGCDSVLEFDGRTLGKPADAADAIGRWRAMRGRSGVLHTGHHLIRLATGKQAEGVASTVVHFSDITDAEINAYVATGEPLYVAGAFTIDGIGGAFLDRIEGDHGTVIGLSLPLFRRLLAETDLNITRLWR